jgi:hypothetical protein
MHRRSGTEAVWTARVPSCRTGGVASAHGRTTRVARHPSQRRQVHPAPAAGPAPGHHHGAAEVTGAVGAARLPGRIGADHEGLRDGLDGHHGAGAVDRVLQGTGSVGGRGEVQTAGTRTRDDDGGLTGTLAERPVGTASPPPGPLVEWSHGPANTASRAPPVRSRTGGGGGAPRRRPLLAPLSRFRAWLRGPGGTGSRPPRTGSSPRSSSKPRSTASPNPWPTHPHSGWSSSTRTAPDRRCAVSRWRGPPGPCWRSGSSSRSHGRPG